VPAEAPATRTDASAPGARAGAKTHAVDIPPTDSPATTRPASTLHRAMTAHLLGKDREGPLTVGKVVRAEEAARSDGQTTQVERSC
jgi:hypothetical protein